MFKVNDIAESVDKNSGIVPEAIMDHDPSIHGYNLFLTNPGHDVTISAIIAILFILLC